MGTRDGGRDVTCSLKDLRIQRSVSKDWLTLFYLDLGSMWRKVLSRKT